MCLHNARQSEFIITYTASTTCTVVRDPVGASNKRRRRSNYTLPVRAYGVGRGWGGEGEGALILRSAEASVRWFFIDYSSVAIGYDRCYRMRTSRPIMTSRWSYPCRHPVPPPPLPQSYDFGYWTAAEKMRERKRISNFRLERSVRPFISMRWCFL